MPFPKRYNTSLLAALICSGTTAAYFFVPQFFPHAYTSEGRYLSFSQKHIAVLTEDPDSTAATSSQDSYTTKSSITTDPTTFVMGVKTPEAVKAIYMTQCVAGTPTFRDKLIALAETTEINSIIIDIKDFSGGIGFLTDNPKLSPYVSDRCRASDMKELIARMHEKGLYVIGRITVFQDPLQTKAHPERAVQSAKTGGVWKDHKGLSFIDVGATPHWEYIVELSRESRIIGFDELNYDYVRYPSDGPMADAHYTYGEGKPKAEALENFFIYLKNHVQDPGLYPAGIAPPKISVDLFGMTTTNTDDLNIGQVLERALPYFDYVAPMVYPSHYPPHFNGWANPNTVPYDLIHFVMKEGARRAAATSTPIHWAGGEPIYRNVEITTGTSTPPHTEKQFTGLYSKPAYDPAQKFRPWLQDFDYGGNYGPKEVRAQIQATYDVGLTSWMLWDPGNTYTREALHTE